MWIAKSPYPPRLFAAMAWRRYRAPEPRGEGPARREIVLDAGAAVDRWIGFTGDICPLRGRSAKYDPAVLAFFAPCDLVVGNLEGVVTERRQWPFLHRHTPAVFDALEALAPADRWVLSLANNHAVDYGEADLFRTLRRIEARSMRWVGTSGTPRVSLGGGVTLTAWTWWVNGTTRALARQDPGAPAAPGVHIAYPHWGYEHTRAPHPDQRCSLPEGYQLIAGHHTHLPQPIERAGNRLVAWSLGNFLTAKRLPVLGEGAVLKVGLATRPDGRPEVVTAHYQEIELDRSDPRRCIVRPIGRTEPSPAVPQPRDAESPPCRSTAANQPEPLSRTNSN